MPQVVSTDCLYTVVENTSGVRRSFSFLGEHGKTLDAGQTYAIPGDIVATYGAQNDLRRFRSLERALAAGDLTIQSTPAPILYDDADNVSRVLAVNNGILGYVDPCWDSAGESDFVDYNG